ncbi:restriction endonuclease [Rhizobium laguerreae]|uniref:restriction endonuclease n=1 Tax=Rhizobium laguerreae TaxID=1076926 RepID=UPI001C926426|nr:restriction endonuclease [Rhizobium laguerreae]
MAHSVNKKQAKLARWHGLQDTPAADPITQPSLARHRLLPIVDVGSVKFEHLCQDLLRNAFKEDVRRVALKRRSGFRQFGADVEGFDELQRPVVVVSCKCYRAIEATEVRLWIEDFRKHLDGHWAKKGVKHFVLAVSVEFKDDDMNDAARALAEDLNARGIRFWIWDSFELSEMLRRDPVTVDRYFNRYWREAIAGDVPEGAPTQTTSALFAVQNPAAIGGIFAQIEAQYLPPLNDLAAKSLEQALKELRRGRRSAFVRWFADARGNDVVWAGTSNEVRSKALRAAAMVALADGDTKEAGALLDQSEVLHRSQDRTARAMLLRATEGLAAAVSHLADPANGKERETLGGFLIESHRPKDALEVLLPMAGNDATSDVMRLRAIAKLLAGGSAGVCFGVQI